MLSFIGLHTATYVALGLLECLLPLLVSHTGMQASLWVVPLTQDERSHLTWVHSTQLSLLTPMHLAESKYYCLGLLDTISTGWQMTVTTFFMYTKDINLCRAEVRALGQRLYRWWISITLSAYGMLCHAMLVFSSIWPTLFLHSYLRSVGHTGNAQTFWMNLKVVHPMHSSTFL